MEHVTLMGAEEVSRAASRMQQAATDMQRAADSIEHALYQFAQRMDDWVGRLEQLSAERKVDES